MILDWLFPYDVGMRHEAVKKIRVENSGLWFLQNHKFQAWISGESDNILYCPGLRTYGYSIQIADSIIAGAGKTFIMFITLNPGILANKAL